MDIVEIKKRHNNGEYMVQMEIPAKVPEHYVFDENLTVKQNREMVVKHNQQVEEKKKERSARQQELSRKFTSDVINYIITNYDISETQARILEAFVYKERESNMSDYFTYIDTVGVMVEEILKVK